MHTSVGFFHIPHNELILSETSRQLRQHVEWDSTSTESTQTVPVFIKFHHFHIDSVDAESYSTLT
jgi:hypothetical protein